MFMNQQHRSDTSGRIARIARAKTEPSPIAIPVELYNIIRDSFVVNALDQNADNPLNNNSQPVTTSIRIRGMEIIVVYYYAEFIRSWLKYIMDNELWSSPVPVMRESRSKATYATYQSSTVVTVSVLRVPSDAEVHSHSGGSQQLEALYKRIKVALVKYLNCSDVAADADLYTVNHLYNGQTLRQSKAATANNVTKTERLERLKYLKLAPVGAARMEVSQFYRAEKMRISYLTERNRKTSDSLIRNLTDEDAAVHNENVIEQLSAKLAQSEMFGANNSSPNNSISNAVTVGKSVNPTAVKMYTIAKRNKELRPGGGANSNKQYKEMVEDYYMLTGYRLNVATEKLDKTLSLRRTDIEWAHQLKQNDNTLIFSHDVYQNRIVAREGVTSQGNVPQRGDVGIRRTDVSLPQRDNMNVAQKDSGNALQRDNGSTTSSRLYSENRRNTKEVPVRSIQQAMVERSQLNTNIAQHISRNTDVDISNASRTSSDVAPMLGDALLRTATSHTINDVQQVIRDGQQLVQSGDDELPVGDDDVDFTGFDKDKVDSNDDDDDDDALAS